MQPFSSADATNSLQSLAHAAAERQNQLEQFSVQPDLSEIDEENDSESPTFDRFYGRRGGKAIVSMITFDPTEFQIIWANYREFVIKNYNCGRGRKSPHPGKDVLFTRLAKMKHGGQWDMMENLFSLKGPTFEGMIMRFANMLSPHFYETR